MSDPADRSSPASGSGRRSRRRTKPVEPFYLSPTLKWPLFDPECCQECGRTIPIHETGWILEEDIHCADCYIVLDEQRTQREAIIQSPAPAPVPPPLAASHTEPEFQLTEPPPFHPSCFAAAMLRVTDSLETSSTMDSLPLFDRTAPQFELTEPPPYHPRLCFAAQLLPTEETTESSTDDSLPLFENMAPPFELTAPTHFEPRANFAGLALTAFEHEESDEHDDALPLFELFATSTPSVDTHESEPEFFEPTWIEEETHEPTVEPACENGEQAIEPLQTLSKSTELPCLVPLVEAAAMAAMPVQIIERTKELQAIEPDEIASPLPAPETAAAAVPMTAVEASEQTPQELTEVAMPEPVVVERLVEPFDLPPKYDECLAPAIEPVVGIEAPPTTEAAPLALSTTSATVGSEHIQPVPPAATEPAASEPPAHVPLESTIAAPPIEPPGVAPIASSVPAAAEVTPIIEAKPQAPRLKARPRKPRFLPPASAAPPPLTFQHPVDALLDELHRQQVDAKVARALHQARARDPFFAEVDAMLAAAVSLRDRWMLRREFDQPRHSQTG